MIPKITLADVHVEVIRVPTSDTLLGSDPIHRKPDYSAVVIRLDTDAGFEGHSVVFTICAGNDWFVNGVKDLAILLKGKTLAEFVQSPATLPQLMMEHHQLRWLADGVFRMAVGSLVNALWDVWAKAEGKPLWELLTDMPSETLVLCIDWRYLQDALTPDEALALLKMSKRGLSERKATMCEQ